MCAFVSCSFFGTTWAQSTQTCTIPFKCRQAQVVMLRVQRGKKPEDWDKRMSTLSGRFLPLDPRDEAVLDVLESDTARRCLDEKQSFGPEGPPAAAYGGHPPSNTKKWSKRSEAARKRWADPAYRSKVLAKRAEKRQKDAEVDGKPPKHKVEIGKMDSITLCDDDKAKAINDYARSNKLRSEKITAYHRDRRLWMENRLRDSPAKLSEEECIKRKKEEQARRRMVALRRGEVMRSRQKDDESTDSRNET